MGRVVSIPCSSGSAKAYQVDRDTTLVAGMAAVTGANLVVVSTDPSLTAAAISGAPAAGASISGDVLVVLVPNSAGFSQNLKIPLSKDSTIYLAASANTWAFLLFDDSFSSNLVT